MTCYFWKMKPNTFCFLLEKKRIFLTNYNTYEFLCLDMIKVVLPPLPIYREFSNERTRVERRETFRKLRMKENFSKAFEGYFQWIIRAGEPPSIGNHHLSHWARKIQKFRFNF